MNYEGYGVVITGATGGLGRVVASTFIKLGANVVLISTNAEKLSSMTRSLELPFERTLTLAADLRHASAVQTALKAVQAKFERTDILIHLVGGWVGGKELVETGSEDLKMMLDQHVLTTFHLIKAFTPLLIASGRGRFIVISSPMANHPVAKMGVYATAKAAEEALTLTLAQEGKSKGLTANILQVRAIDIDHQRDKGLSLVNSAWSTPEEITAAIVYLCSPGAKLVNGIRLTLFG